MRPIRACLPFALQTQYAKRKLIIPTDNAREASLSAADIYPAKHLLDVSAHFSHQKKLTVHEKPPEISTIHYHHDFSDVIGQYATKRALEIAAAGNHNLLMLGSPGAGKTMLAERMPTILPPMTTEEAVETISVYSISDQAFQFKHWGKRPFRAPHHTASGIALVGGGSQPKPGEISLAHNGILFLDEFPEFNRKVIETLREPMESGKIHIARAQASMLFPAKFQLIAAMNPCPCGYLGSPTHSCTCTSEQVQRYQSKISGPILDRIDIQVRVNNLPTHAFLKPHEAKGENSDTIRKRVIAARDIAIHRANVPNAQLSNQQVKQCCALNTECENILEKALDQFNLSARAYHKVLKLSRTIADLAQEKNIQAAHLYEALGYRGFKQR